MRLAVQLVHRNDQFHLKSDRALFISPTTFVFNHTQQQNDAAIFDFLIYKMISYLKLRRILNEQ